MPTGELRWDACLNVRDLGGLALADGGETRRGALVRSDRADLLSASGRRALVEHGVRTILDLRGASERDGARPVDGVETVRVPLFGDDDAAFLAAAGAACATMEEFYVYSLANRRAAFAAAVAAVADAPAGGVLVHCQGGRDRTGIVVALLLALVGVPDPLIAEDYAASEPSLQPMYREWIEEADDSDERGRRREAVLERACRPELMLHVLAWLRERYGGVESYLLAGGVTERQLARAQARLAAMP
jgi:protein-tyrosine phosphatase